MTGLITADLHLNDNPRDAYRHDFISQLPGIAKDIKADWVAILGDLTEEKDRHGAWLVNRIVNHIWDIAQAVPRVYVLRGNHDYLEEENPFYAFINKIERVTWINTPTTINFNSGHEALFLPHTSDYKRDWAKHVGGRIVFAHNTFEGATGESGRELHGIPLDVIKDCDRVISGDIHKPQKIKNLTYVGAPYTIDFGDDYEPRMLKLDTKRNTVSELLCNGPQKRLIEITDVKQLPRVTLKGDVYKVRIHLSLEQHQDWHKIKDLISRWAEQHGVHLHQAQPIVTRTLRLKKASGANLQTSDTDLLRKYAKVRGVDERTLKTGLNLMDQQ